MVYFPGDQGALAIRGRSELSLLMLGARMRIPGVELNIRFFALAILETCSRQRLLYVRDLQDF